MQILGHRGAPADPLVPDHSALENSALENSALENSAPENSAAAVTAALDAGADGVEIDVRLTRDGVAVCCHDDDLLRVAGVPLHVPTSTWQELRAVRLPGGHRLARLEEIASVLAGRGRATTRLVLDLKPERRAAALLVATRAALAVGGLSERHVVASSFDPGVLDAFAARSSGLTRAPICDNGCDPRAALRAALVRGDRAVHLPLAAVLRESAAVRDAVSAGLEVRVWTVNRPLDARMCELLGVSAVITDAPRLLTGALRAGSLRAGSPRGGSLSPVRAPLAARVPLARRSQPALST